MDSHNQRNLILAVLLTGLVLFGWDAGIRYFYPNADKPAVTATAPVASAPGEVATPTRDGGLTSAADVALVLKIEKRRRAGADKRRTVLE